MTTESIFWLVLSAILGGTFVLIGLLMETLAEKKRFKNITSLRRWQSIKRKGEWIVIFGIVIEIGTGVFSATDAWQTRQIAAKNNPLLQPVSQVSATLLLTVDAATYAPQREQSMANTFFNFGSGSITNWEMYQVFSLGASEGRYFLRTHAPANGIMVMGVPPKIAAYTIALRFEQPALPLPGVQPENLENTNDLEGFAEITVTNALNKITLAEAYIDFLPTNTIIIQGKATLSVNGFLMDFYFQSNSINRQMSKYNPDRKGIFLESVSNKFHSDNNR